MKQHITIDQYQELSDDAKIKLAEWVSKRTKTTDPLTTIYQDMTIGRMIEFLGLDYWKNITYFPPEDTMYLLPELNAGVQPEILCDTLWDAVKAKLIE